MSETMNVCVVEAHFYRGRLRAEKELVRLNPGKQVTKLLLRLVHGATVTQALQKLHCRTDDVGNLAKVSIDVCTQFSKLCVSVKLRYSSLAHESL